jgi:hypothetical protein
MATNTYVALDKATVTTATPSITFTGISGAYTDLVVVAANLVATSGNPNVGLTFNGDTASNYSATILEGTGSVARSVRKTSTTLIVEGDNVSLGGTNPSTIIYNIMNYSNTTTYKTALLRNSELSTTYPGTGATVGLWRSTAAITSVTLTIGSGNFAVGSTFSLYGIKSEEAASKATGGYVTSDSQYYYHTFLASGTFTPTQSLTCDYLVVAGGGGGGCNVAGGGGAGGLRSTVTATGGGGSLESAISLASATAYTVTIGGGGAGGTASDATSGSDGVSSSIAGTGLTTITSVGGGGGGTYAGTINGRTGGSGGGGASKETTAGVGGAGTANQGYAGGNGFIPTSVYPGGGGGGAGAVGANGSASQAGNGGAGVAVSITGTSVSYGGGGGGGNSATAGTGGTGGGGNGSNSTTDGTNGTVNTGGGGGGGHSVASNHRGYSGGSGIVIVRYLKA